MDLEPRRKGFSVYQSSMTHRQRIAMTVLLLVMTATLITSLVALFVGE